MVLWRDTNADKDGTLSHVSTAIAMTANACHHPKPSIQNKLPHQLPLATQKITCKITSETYNGVDDATPAPKSISYDKPLCNCLLKIR